MQATTAVVDAAAAAKKKQGDQAVERIERWNLRQYFFNMLQYAAAKHLPWPRIDFTLNGQLLFRLEIDSVDDDDDDDETSGDENTNGGAKKSNRLEFLLKYYGAQEQFLTSNAGGALALDSNAGDALALDSECLANCRFQSLPTDDTGDDQAPAFCACPLDKRFEFILADTDAPSKLCYAATFSPLSLAMLDTVLALVQAWFRSLESRGIGANAQQFAAAPLWSIERLFYSTLHDAAAVAIEIKCAADESGTSSVTTATAESGGGGGDAAVATLEREWQAAAQEAERAARALCTEKIVSSCQLHADIWQYNEKHRITAIGRQYENLARHERIGDAMHVPFRGAADELQKKIHIGEFLVKMLPTVCCALAAK